MNGSDKSTTERWRAHPMDYTAHTTTAYATTSTNTLGADAGLSVFNEIGEELDREDVEGGALDLTDGDLDRDAADAILKDMHYERTEPWRESGGQWAATVEPTA